MANIFPTLSSGSMQVRGTLANGAIAMYPTSLVFSYVTRVITFVNSSEQRWTVRNNLFGAVLEYRRLNGYDLSLLRNFFIQMKGSYVDAALLNTFSITIGGNTYNYCAFDQDTFDSVCDSAENYSTTLKIKQVRPN